MKLSNQELKRAWGLLIEIFELSQEQTKAIDYQIPMTQEIYNSILDRCYEIGSDLEPLLFRMLSEYPDFSHNYAKHIQKEVEDSGIVVSEETVAGFARIKERIRERILSEYVEDIMNKDNN